MIFRAFFLRWDMWITLKNGAIESVCLEENSLVLDAHTISWILWTGCQVCGIMKCHRMNLKITNCDFSKNKRSDDSRKTNTDCFLQTKTIGSIDVLFELTERRPNLTCQRHACQMCAVFGFRRVLTHGNQPFWHMAALKISSWKWPRKYNRCFASQTFITLAVWWDGV